MEKICPRCGTESKTWIFEGHTNWFCPNCEEVSVTITPPGIYVGEAMSGIEEKTGIFRMKVELPEEANGQQILVRVPGKQVVTKPRELRIRGRRIYRVRGRTATVYPEIRRGDRIGVAVRRGERGILSCIYLRNLTLGASKDFIEPSVKIPRGFMRGSFTIRNPILKEAEDILDRMLKLEPSHISNRQ